MSTSRLALRPSRPLHTSGTIVAATGLLLIALATLPAGGPRTTPAPAWQCLVCGATGGIDVALNVLLFVPLGIGLRLRGVSVVRTALAALCVSLFVESWQYLVVNGRDATVSDVLTNTIGGTLGATVVATHTIWLLPSARRASALVLGALLIAVCVLVATAIGLLPSIEPRLYYAQIEPRLTNREVFSGRLLSTSLNGRRVDHEGELQQADGAPTPVMVDGRVEVGAALLAGPKLVQKAPILRITNSNWEAVALVQERDALVFRGRDRAVDARLVAPGLAVAGLLPRTPPAAPDTVLVRAVLERAGLRMDVTRGGVLQSYSLPFRVALGWSFLLPYFTVDHRFVALASAVWLAVLLGPLGYWSARAPLAVGVVGVLIVGAVLILLPVVTRLAPTAPAEWVGALAGFGAGAYLARAVAHRHGRHVAGRARRDGIADVTEIVRDAIPGRRT